MYPKMSFVTSHHLLACELFDCAPAALGACTRAHSIQHAAVVKKQNKTKKQYYVMPIFAWQKFWQILQYFIFRKVKLLLV